MESSLVSWYGDQSFDVSLNQPTLNQPTLNQPTYTEIIHAKSFRKQARDEQAKTGGITKDLIEFFEHTSPTGPYATDLARLEATISTSQESSVSTQGIDFTKFEEAGSTSPLIITQSLSRRENKKRGLVAKMFSRSSASSSKRSLEKEGQMVSCQAVQDREVEDGSFDAPNPAHYLKPLQHRMQARKETGLKPPKCIEDSEATISPITIARNRGEAARRLQGHFDEEAVEYDLASPKVQSVMGLVMSTGLGSEDDPGSRLEVARDQNVDAEEKPEEDIEEEANIFQFHELDDVILDLCPNGKWDKHWDSYMTSYSKGQFNLSNPPKPPAFKDRFDFLPSVYPPNEARRLGMSEDFEILWPHWGQDNSAELIRIAMTKFEAKSVSLSFFDEENEVFRAENGYNQPNVARTHSIAAHCLLSKDVLVVLDTKEDWRFRHNPLVSGRPKIRFFAGPSEQTPPSSAESNLHFYANSPESCKEDGPFKATSSISKQLFTHGSYLSGLRGFSPRPFSSSDITSLHPHPPNTPARSFIEDLSTKPQFDLTAEDFMIGGDSSAESYRQAMPTTNPFYDGYTGGINRSENARVLEHNSSTALQQRELAANIVNSRDKGVGHMSSEIGPAAQISITQQLGFKGKNQHGSPSRMGGHSAFSSAPPAPFLDMIEGFSDEAAFMCEVNAQNLGYDMVYAVTISPARPGMSDQEMLAPDGLRTEILVAHGLNQPLVLSPACLLRVLQSKRAEHWTDPAAKREAGEYYSGRLIPIASDGYSGIIMGAFRFPDNISQDGDVGSPSEMEKIWKFCEVLGAVLFRKSRKCPERSNTEPTAHPATDVRRAIIGNVARHRRS
ncbi:hypothetical protein PZA11_003683 [Diplocarpon coronariae]